MDHEEFMAYVNERAAKRRAKKPRAVPVSERLKARLIGLGWPVDTIERVRAGHIQRSAGAWSWVALGRWEGGGAFDIGSSETMAYCLALSDEELKRELGFSTR